MAGNFPLPCQWYCKYCIFRDFWRLCSSCNATWECTVVFPSRVALSNLFQMSDACPSPPRISAIWRRFPNVPFHSNYQSGKQSSKHETLKQWVMTLHLSRAHTIEKKLTGKGTTTIMRMSWCNWKLGLAVNIYYPFSLVFFCSLGSCDLKPLGLLENTASKGGTLEPVGTIWEVTLSALLLAVCG